MAAARAAAVCATVLLVPGCAYLVLRSPPLLCQNTPDSPIPDFCVMVPGTLWEGKRPSAVDVRWLLTHGVASIVSIQVDDHDVLRDIHLPSQVSRSIPYFRIRKFNAIRLLSRPDLDDRVALFLAIMRTAPKPLYVHCRLGVDRALLLAVAYRIIVQGLDVDQAVHDIRGLHSPWLPAEIRYLRSLTAARRRRILQRVAYWIPRAEATAQIRCAQGGCGYRPL